MENAKKEKFDEIASLLTLFGGEMTLNDILDQDIPILNSLRDAKLRLNEKTVQEKMKQQTKNNANSAQIKSRKDT